MLISLLRATRPCQQRQRTHTRDTRKAARARAPCAARRRSPTLPVAPASSATDGSKATGPYGDVAVFSSRVIAAVDIRTSPRSEGRSQQDLTKAPRRDDVDFDNEAYTNPKLAGTVGYIANHLKDPSKPIIPLAALPPTEAARCRFHRLDL